MKIKILLLSTLFILTLLGCSNSLTSNEDFKEHKSVVIKNEHPEKFDVYLFIFNTNMEPVKTFTPEDTSGSHTIVWNRCDDAGNKVASGVYYYTLVSGENTISRSMLLLK